MGIFSWLFGAKPNNRPTVIDTHRLSADRPTNPSKRQHMEFPPVRLDGPLEVTLKTLGIEGKGDYAREVEIGWQSVLPPLDYRAARRPEGLVSILVAEITATAKAAENFEVATYDMLNDVAEFGREMTDVDDERYYEYSTSIKKSGENLNVTHTWHGVDGDRSKVIGKVPPDAARIVFESALPLTSLRAEMVEWRSGADDAGRPKIRYTIEIFGPARD